MGIPCACASFGLKSPYNFEDAVVCIWLLLGEMAAQGSSLANYNNELGKDIDVHTDYSCVLCHSPHTLSVGCIEDLREKREELNRSILRDEEEKGKIQKVSSVCVADRHRYKGCQLPRQHLNLQDLSVLTERLSRINEDLARKMQGAWGMLALPLQ